jgi:hypothetical protein
MSLWRHEKSDLLLSFPLPYRTANVLFFGCAVNDRCSGNSQARINLIVVPASAAQGIAGNSARYRIARSRQILKFLTSAGVVRIRPEDVGRVPVILNGTGRRHANLPFPSFKFAHFLAPFDARGCALKT